MASDGADEVEAAGARAARVRARLDTLYAIGLDRGTNRAGLGPGEQQAHDLVAGWMRDAGLAVAVDAAGNLLGILAGSEPDLAQVWPGSHLDTPPDGGRFDGALGVLMAVEALAAIAADGPRRRTLVAHAFRLEEGPRFGRGVFGSRAICGQLGADEGELTDADAVTLAAAFAQTTGHALPASGWLGAGPSAFVEAHIEQGPLLAADGAPLGLVTSIAGMAGFEVAFDGRRGHAGTVPMALRADALAAGAAFVAAVQRAARAVEGAVATIGRIGVYPGATNTIPERCTLFADVRAPGEAALGAVVTATLAAARDAAGSAGCTAEVAERWRYAPVAMAAAPMAAIRHGMEVAGVAAVELASGAGHDAAVLALSGIPCGMLFVRSNAGGVSHSPEEDTDTAAVALGLRALEHALRELAEA